ncbi:hypothetical protein [uncultured Chryseobacterium sp.]|uniref:hypothetical protein n=1 Tax=uncultured Chryseobacterium sp. TaxID=259322 RepID=UPI0025F6A32F|nr:hypothetical protein [uncultured Chryseobacterium sp.]
MEENIKKHKIRVPIFSSEVIEREIGLYDDLTYLSMINNLKKKIDNFNESMPTIRQPKINKVKETQISAIEYFEESYEEIPTLLIKITAYNTNLIDGFVELDEKINLQKNHKVGSDTNYLLALPQIYGQDSSKFVFQWKFFVYDDPTKDSSEIISICKLLCKKILDIKIRNLKLESILKEIKQNKLLENFEIQLSSHYEQEDDPDVKLKNYLITSKVSKTTKNSYKDVPTDKFEEILFTKNNFNKRVFKVFKNNREIRITEEQKNDFNKLSQTIEEILNSQIEFHENDLDKIFEKDFIMKNLNSIITEFTKQSIQH